MNQNWALVTPSKELVLVSDNYRLLKFVQLILAKSYFLDLVPQSEPRLAEHPLTDKATYLLSVISIEDRNIEKLHQSRSGDNFKNSMKAAKEFYDLVLPDNEIITRTVDLEIQELENYRSACNIHLGFILQNLYKIDYHSPLDQIKTQFWESLKNPPSDHYYVYEELQQGIEEGLRQHGLF